MCVCVCVTGESVCVSGIDSLRKGGRAGGQETGGGGVCTPIHVCL